MFSNKAFNKIFRIFLCQSDRESANFCVSIESYDSVVGLSCFQKSVSVSLSARNLVSFSVVVGHHFHLWNLINDVVALGREGFVFDVFVFDPSLQCFDAAVELSSEVLAVPVELPFNLLGEPFAFESLADDCSGSIGLGLCLAERVNDLGDGVTVNDHCVEAESLEPFIVDGSVMAVHRSL